MSVPQKILISGYSHCGTSILKSIIGHIEDVEEIIDECDKINKVTDKKYILCKSPQIQQKFFSEEYKDYIRILIIRNPLFVFSSLNKRYGHYKLSEFHSIKNYIFAIKMFLKYKNNPETNIYTIRYEDLFENNFYNLKEILNKIDLKYDDSIFNNTNYKNAISSNTELVYKKPKNTDHAKYRTWQINQPFISNNDVSKLDLSEIQKQQIINNPHILRLYPDISSMC